jgi:mono/diheme cytochrome c family protein
MEVLVVVVAGLFVTETRGGDGASVAARGREAIECRSLISALWGAGAYEKAGALWGDPNAPDPTRDPDAYGRAFGARYGLAYPAPYANDGLPMGLRHATRPDGSAGLAIDCMACHGGSIGGQSILGLGNTQLDLHGLFHDLTRADGGRMPPSVFALNTTRGTNNAGMLTVVLLSGRNADDLTPRRFPALTGAWLPELDTPAWWILGRKRMKMYDGRTDARASRSNMQFLLGDPGMTLERLKGLEGDFADIDAYLKTLRAPEYPLAMDGERAERGRVVFERECARCHGRYGDGGALEYPNRVVPIEEIGTDRARLDGLSEGFIRHYNATWIGRDFPVTAPKVGYQAPPLDGVWATAPYFHNGSVPTLWHVLKSDERPDRYRRPATTGLENYDAERVGWRYEEVAEGVEENGMRTVYDARRFGLGNGGHTYGDGLSEAERWDVIEYLKGL